MIPPLLATFSQLLRSASDGDLAFTRCFSQEEINSLLARSGGRIDTWDLRGVGQGYGEHGIGADEAVELREDKGRGTILLVDTRTAGAGMDGIYNAARELSEQVLFDKAIKIAERNLTVPLQRFAAEAHRQAKKVGGRRVNVPLRRYFDFLEALASEPPDQIKPGHYLPRLGLWPVTGNAENATEMLGQSARVVERLLLATASSPAPASRAASLVLDQDSQAGSAEVEALLRKGKALPMMEVLEQVAEDERLWLGNMKPGFLKSSLAAFEIVPWRSKGQKLLTWSGLLQKDEESLPQFVLDPNNPKCKLEVRWTVKPEDLPKGAASYDVRLLAGDEEITSRKVEHNGKAEMKAIFTPDDFEDLEESARIEVCLEVSAGEESLIPPKKTEDFLLCLGVTTLSTPTETSGEMVWCVADGAAQAGSKEELSEFLAQRQQGKQGQPEKPKPGGAEKNGVLSFRLPEMRKGFRVERPRLLQEIEKSWERQRAEAPVGRWRARCRADGSWSDALEFVPLSAGACPEGDWKRLQENTRRFCEDCLRSGASSRGSTCTAMPAPR